MYTEGEVVAHSAQPALFKKKSSAQIAHTTLK
jgi:hypothetical protein